jgi:RND family efflux transporter MFP subunit
MKIIKVILIVFSIVSCGHGHGHGHGDKHEDSKKKKNSSDIILDKNKIIKLGIETGKVQLEYLNPYTITVGEFVPLIGKEVKINSTMKGTLLPLATNLNYGQFVKKDQILGAISPWISDSKLEIRKSEYYIAWSQYQNEKSKLKRMKNLVNRGIEAKMKLNDSLSSFQVAQARLSASWQNLSRVKKATKGKPDTINKRLLKTPIEGVLLSSNYIPGTIVLEGKPLFHIVNINKLNLKVQVFENNQILNKKPTEIWFETKFSKTKHSLKVHENSKIVLPQINRSNGTISIYFQVKNRDHKFLLGQKVKVFLSYKQKHKSICVPKSAILQDGYSKVVFISKGEYKYERKKVELGKEDAFKVEVKSGLKHGDVVVVKNAMEILYVSLPGKIPQTAHTH